MKQLIMDVLDDMSTGQINLESEASRKLIANTIMAAIKTKGDWFLDLSTFDGGPKLDTPIYEKSDEQQARESWVCSICGKSTYEVDYDYIGSGTNHLGCELKLEMKGDKRVTKDRRKDDRREKNWLQKKHENKVFGGDTGIDADYGQDLQKQIYNEMTTDGLPEGGDTQAVLESRKLAEDIVDNKEEKYIYESPDGGKTVYKRVFGECDRVLIKDWEDEKSKIKKRSKRRIK